MLLTISTTHAPATDLGYLLHKHPDRVQQFEQPFGTATVCYPEATPERCTAALVLEVDPIALARGRGRRSPDASLAQYINDRPYAVSSLFAVAMADVFSTARSGRCRSKQELADSAIDLTITIPVLPCRGGPELAERVFAPLGWQVRAVPIALDESLPDWGNSRYVELTLTGTVRLADALNQLYVLLPTLDESKHYWQGPDEVDKLFRSAEGWLVEHPERELITRRYLGHRELTRDALARLGELAGVGPSTELGDREAPEGGDRTPLNVLRRKAVLAALRDLGARSVADLGCGPGALLAELVRDPRFTRITGVDVSTRALQQAARRLHTDEMDDHQRERVQLLHGALTYSDPRLAGHEAAVLMEVIEHVDPSRLPALERVVFGEAKPSAVIVTTPNSEHNVHYEGLDGMRHHDHRFEWDRATFADWAGRVDEQYGYRHEIRGVGDDDPTTGAPTQMAVFTRV